MLTLPVLGAVLGVMPVTVGVRMLVTLKTWLRVADRPSGLVTTTSHIPGAAPARLSVQEMRLGLDTVAPEAVISVYPALRSFTTAPDLKPTPRRSETLIVPVLMPDPGATAATSGAQTDETSTTARPPV